MQFLSREQLAHKIGTLAAGQRDLGGFALRSSTRVQCVRGDLSGEDIAKVKAELGDDAAKSRLVRFVLSTENRASDGHVIFSTAWLLEKYRNSIPVVLFQHDRWSLRIGESVVWVDAAAKVLRGICSFHPRELNEFSWQLGEIAALRGHAASVGWNTLSAMPAPEDIRKKDPWALDIMSAELREWSLVNIAADPDAIDDARAAGLATDAIARELGRMLDDAVAAGADRAKLERAWNAARGAAPIVVDMKPVAPSAAEMRKALGL